MIINIIKINFLVLLFTLSLFANDNITIIKDLKYSNHYKNYLDIYMPKNNLNKKVIFMVHGGGWMFGDKASKNIVKNKVNFWVSKGYTFISTNYRLVPDVNVNEQAKDVAKALAFSQNYLKTYGIKSKNFTLMGHSAGAHLVSLLASSPNLVNSIGVKPWSATISIDTGVFDLISLMGNKHLRIFDKAFGKDETFWKLVSPYNQLNQKTYPFLIICSTKRKTSCLKSESYISKLKKLDTYVEVLKIDLNHKNLNKKLGLNNEYTKQVDTFLTKF